MYKNIAIATLTALYTIELCQRISSVQLSLIQYVSAVAFLTFGVWAGAEGLKELINRRKAR